MAAATATGSFSLARGRAKEIANSQPSDPVVNAGVELPEIHLRPARSTPIRGQAYPAECDRPGRLRNHGSRKYHPHAAEEKKVSGTCEEIDFPDFAITLFQWVIL